MIGKMRDRLEIQQRIDTQDAYGQLVATWNTVAVRWANVEPLAGRTFWAAQQAQSDVTHTITLRYYPGLEPERFRFKKDNRVFNITSALDLEERHVWHECRCVERVV
jgi:SPP1 family predicted phage head-tail adaptor